MSLSRQTSRTSVEGKIDGPGCKRAATRQQFILLKNAILPMTTAHRRQQPGSGSARNMKEHICVSEIHKPSLLVCERARSLKTNTKERRFRYKK
jgi:hypothetical protein